MAIALLILAFIVLFVLLLKLIGTLIGIVVFLAVATLCAAAAEYFLGHREGLGETLLIGLIGAAGGALLAHVLHFPSLLVVGHISIVWTIIGSMIIVGLLKLARPQRGAVRRIR